LENDGERGYCFQTRNGKIETVIIPAIVEGEVFENIQKMMNNTKNETTSIVTLLGDGDFTYALDLARYLAESVEATNNAQLVATGIDTQEELLSKYKDARHILEQLDDAAAKSPRLSITVKHSVNAILPPATAGHDDDLQAAAKMIRKSDHVIFNHPHLGTEDAALHGRFLCHFFHSCVRDDGWLKPSGGLVHLALVDGQYERWGCEQAAKRQGLMLVQRVPFSPPPVKHNPSYYHYRRHQTGKSFESRRPRGSETFVFAREQDARTVDVSKGLFSWPKNSPSSSSTPNESEATTVLQPSPSTALSCPHCDRVFKEERSRKCHLRDRHPNAAEKKAKLLESTPNSASFECALCQTETGEARTFTSEQALQDHKRAKHSAIHKTIQPDWAAQNESSSQPPVKVEEDHDEDSSIRLTCEVCAATFGSKENEATHMESFKPVTSGDKFACQFCRKAFREIRAKLQHENFCKSRQ
jgi:hypothetical protein